ncbi:DUF4041 domain-containing protein [Lacibacter luteus]|uniref:DUF4041 domain-containing protein n=2 Tax=Lacibacter luteus TaxID=2508719 RepID=A0A4Q1CG50_9BACT|nr:DUF4041 domain-containing protein [Lacibacter luteus]
MLSSAHTEADSLILQAKEELEDAKEEASGIRREANSKATELKDKASAILNSANNESVKIVADANSKAEQIAGDAYKALQKANELEGTIKAMQNIIEGYGDKYLVPTYSLLDELAEEFGHLEAGEMLKKARQLSTKMTENGTGAKCDYVEANRKEIAIRFVLDAFNGKVDSILSKVKKDNYGTLQQKIKDAYQLVNYNGTAFRNAAITEAYLNARLDELKWAVVAQELKWQEQEEQRRIKEQIREEEKARREFERAMKEAQKEEETLKKLIEKAQSEVAKANEEQKEKFELQLLQLEEKLKAAEEKNQRAMSMAQQTKSGNVYIISNIGSFGEDVFKIGMTRRLEPLDRIRELGDASVPFEFDVHSMIFSEDAPGLERQLHKLFLKMQMNKINPRKEFFKVTLTDIKDEIEKMGLNPKWTMAAEAKQYRESLALEEAMKKDVKLQEEWVENQLKIDPVSVEEFEETSSN